MKKTMLAVFAAGLLIATPSCKKGENDPTLSLKSRKARITNEWVISSITNSLTEVDISGDEKVTDYTYDGNTVTVNVKETNSGVTTSTTDNNTTVQLSEYIINNDGTYNYKWNDTEIKKVNDFFGTGYITYTTVTTTDENGKWSFVGKSKGDYKSKERIVFNTTSTDVETTVTSIQTNGDGSVDPSETSNYKSADTYAAGEKYTTFDINQLKGKEVILTRSIDSKNSDINGGITYTTTETGTSKMILTKK